MSRLFLRMRSRSWGLVGRWRWSREEKRRRLYILDEAIEQNYQIVSDALLQLNSNFTTWMRGVSTLNRDMS
jgi:hypothetical protein